MKDARERVVQVTFGQPDDDGAGIVRSDGYGPWTVTPEPRRDADPRSRRARLVADVFAFVGSRDGNAFATPDDDVLAVSDGFERYEHERLRTAVRKRRPVAGEPGIGRATAPVGVEGAIDHVWERTRVERRGRVGRGVTPQAAGTDAKRVPETGRRPRRRVPPAGPNRVGT